MSKIFVKPIGGLCNRIRVIDSLLTLIADRNQRLVVIWEKNKSLNCSYNDLFELNDSFDLMETRPVFRGFHFPFYPTIRPIKFHHRTLFRYTRRKFGIPAGNVVFFDELGEKLKPLRPVTPEKFLDHRQFDLSAYAIFEDVVDTLQSETSSYLSTCWRMTDSPRYSQNFIPSTEIAKQVTRITSRFSENTFGLHIRGTDFETAKKFSSEQAFDDQIQQLIATNQDASFFLASDEREIKSRLIKKYSPRIYHLDQQTYRRDSPQSMQNALIDLLCLSQTQHLFGSYFSSFSQLASDWQGIEETTVLNDHCI